MNNDFEKNNNTNQNIGEEISNDNENAQNIQESQEESKQILQDEVQANEEEAKAAFEEEKDNTEEGNTAEEDGEGSDVNPSQTCYANYTPPYYTPNVTVSDGTSGQAGEKKEKKGVSIGVVIAMCGATLAIAIIFGTLAGALAGKLTSANRGTPTKDTVNIITSDRELVVEEIPGNTDYDNLTVAQVAALVEKQVVEITTAQKKTNGSYIESGAGSGVIFGQGKTQGDYYIVTNYHVIGDVLNTDGVITVKIKNDKSATGYEEYTAQYLAGDEREDIAVLTVTPKEGHVLYCADMTDSSKLSVGEEVVAIGNPLGTLGGTVTNGIISALDREIIVGNYPMTLLQTNAAINPGNSGGGLFDMKGKLVGIVNAKQFSTGIEGLGFAIPSNVVKKSVSDLLEYGYIRDRAALGIKISQEVNSYTGKTTIIVAQSSSDGTLKEGDTLLEVNGKTVSSMSDCYYALKNVSVGDVVSVKVKRGVREITVKVTTTEYNPIG